MLFTRHSRVVRLTVSFVLTQSVELRSDLALCRTFDNFSDVLPEFRKTCRMIRTLGGSRNLQETIYTGHERLIDQRRSIKLNMLIFSKLIGNGLNSPHRTPFLSIYWNYNSLCLFVLLAVAGSSLANPVPRRKMGRIANKDNQGRLLPITLFNNGATTVAPGTVVTADEAAATVEASAAATPVHGAITPVHGAITPAHGATTHSASSALPPTRNLNTLVPIPVENLPPAATLANNLNKPNVGIPALPTLPTTIPQLTALLNPFNIPFINNIWNALPFTQNGLPGINLNKTTQPAVAGAANQPSVYIWTPATGAVPYHQQPQKRLLDEPEQMDPNYLNLVQHLYYSSLQNAQPSNYLTPQLSTPIGYTSQSAYAMPYRNVNPYIQPPIPAYQPYAAPPNYPSYSGAINPYSPMYLITVTPFSKETSNPEKPISNTGIETIKEVESKPGMTDQETSVETDTENEDTAAMKPESEQENATESQEEEEPVRQGDDSQESDMEQITTQGTGSDQQVDGMGTSMQSNDSQMNSESTPSKIRGNSKFYVKFNRDGSNQQRRLYQRPQSRSDHPSHDRSHAPLVSSYRLQHSSSP